MALQGSHTVGLEQGSNAGSQTFNDVGLAADHRCNVHLHFTGGDAVDGKSILGFVILPGAVQQRLGWNATDVQASTAQCQFAFLVGVLFDASSRKTQLRGLDGGNVAAGARTNHYNVKFLCHKRFPFSNKLQAASCKFEARQLLSLRLGACSLPLLFRYPAADALDLPAGF